MRYAVVGTGMMGLEHLRNLALIPGARVTAVCDPHPESLRRAADLAEELWPGRPRMLAERVEALVEADLDAVIVATPNHTHHEVLEPLWATPLHLLIEKPLATTLRHCQDIERRAAQHRAQHDAVVWTAMEYRYMPPVARLIERVHRGDIGTPRMLTIREHRFPFLRKVGDWNRFSRNTGGTLVEKCCHFFDLMLLITGSEPTRVYASGAQDVNHLGERYATAEQPDGERPDILDNAFVLVDFENGMRACLDLCMFAEASRNEQEISVVGDEAKIESLVPESVVRFGRRSDFRFGRAPGKAVRDEPIAVDEALLAAGHHHGSTYYQHQRFRAACLEQGEVEVTARDGRRAVALGVAAQESIASGRPVTWVEVDSAG